jgi:hypothetical protein
MNTNQKEKLITEWKQLRGKFFNLLNEDTKKFEKAHIKHPLYRSVVKHFDKSFMEVNQIAESEIDIFLKDTTKEN